VAQALAAKALEHFYSAEFLEAVETYREAARLDPSDPALWRGMADGYLFQLLLVGGRLDSGLYTEANEFVRAKPVPPDPQLIRQMWEAIAQARKLCEARLRSHPNDQQARYELGMSYAGESTYNVMVARKYWDGLRAASKARDHHRNLLKADPAYHDAKLVLGVYEYFTGSLPAPIRWIVRLAGYHVGSKTKGIELLEDAMQRGSRSLAPALSLLAVVHNRERRYGEAREVVERFAQLYPRNFIAPVEIAYLHLREGNRPAAIRQLQVIREKRQAGAPGLHRVDAAKLYFQLAGLLEQEKRSAEAAASYRELLGLPDKDPALEGQSLIRLGDILRANGHREEARGMYERAVQSSLREVARQGRARLRALDRAR